MAYIIDGHNLIGVMPGISLAQPDDEERLIDRLLSYRGQAGGEMIVFFDGNPLSASALSGLRRSSMGLRPGIAVYYAPPGKTADDAIVDFLRASPEPGQYAVVTNDRGLTGRARDLGASILSASEFVRRLTSRQAKESVSAEDHAVAPNPRDPAYADLYDEFLAADKARQRAAGSPMPDAAGWIERLYTGDLQLQLRSANWLGQSRDPNAIAPLRDALTAKDAALRAGAVLALGALRSVHAIPDLALMVAEDGNSMVREACAQALGMIGSPQGIPALEAAAAGDTKSKVRKAARSAIEVIRARR